MNGPPCPVLIGPALVAGFLFVGPAHAQVPSRIPVLCFPDRDQVIERLAQQHGEALVAQGLSAGGWILELLVNPDDGDFTVVLAAPDGRACLTVTGTDWHDVPHATPGPAL